MTQNGYARDTIQSGGDREISGTFVFTGERSRRGYRLNKFAMSMIDPACREAFVRDEAGYMTRMNLSAEEMAMVRRRDWDAMIRYGGNIYILLKVAGALGISLLEMGAQMRGETLAAFQKTRPGAAAEVMIAGPGGEK